MTKSKINNKFNNLIPTRKMRYLGINGNVQYIKLIIIKFMIWNLIIKPLFVRLYIIIYSDDYKFYILQGIYYEVTLKVKIQLN